MKIEHIALYVNDLEKTRNFFMKYLGAKSNKGYHNLITSFRSYFLSFDDGARLEIMNKPEMPDLPKELARTGYAHIAFSVGSKEKEELTNIINFYDYVEVQPPEVYGHLIQLSDFKDVNELQPQNMHSILVTLLVSKLLKSKVVKELQSLNIQLI